MISVVMCTYNGVKYVKEQLDSILRQTFSDFELVVCDDCSNDGTWEFLQEYATGHENVRLYRNDQNLGFLKNFEKVLGLASGDYIALSDQDDIWMTNHLEVLISLLGEKTIACGNSLLVDENGASLGMTLKEQEDLTVVSDNPLDTALSIMVYRNPFQGATMLFRRSFLEKVLPIPDGVKYHDSWFAAMACFMEGISYSDEVLLNYRIHNHNLSGYHQPRNRKEFVKKRMRGEFVADRPAMLKGIMDSGAIDTIPKRWIARLLKEYFATRNSKMGRLRRKVFSRLFVSAYRKAVFSL